MTQNIPTTPEARKIWLQDHNNRNSIARGGAGAVYFFGDLSDPRNLKIVISTRAKGVGAGLAHFGGLAEDCDTVEGDPLQTGINNACREGCEEMAELLGHEPALDKSRFIHLYTACDDGFFIKNGRGFAVNARLHAYEMESELFETLFPNGSVRRDRHADHPGRVETSHAEVMTFFDALQRADDYFYAHEYFALWVMAVNVMQQDFARLIEQVNVAMAPACVDFSKLAERMHTDLDTLEKHLGESCYGALTGKTPVKPAVKKFKP